MSLIEFLVHLGLYDSELTQTPAYDELLISRPPGDSVKKAWSQLSTVAIYDPNWTKATTLRSLLLRYIHYFLSHSLTGCGNSNEVVSCHNFDFLLSIVDGFHLYLGYEVAVSITHQGTILALELCLLAPTSLALSGIWAFFRGSIA